MNTPMNKQRAVSSKWTKTRVLARSNSLAPHIPTTRRLNRRTLSLLLKKHGMVYVKPVSGSCGIGVMRLDQQKGKWIVRDGRKRTKFGTFHAQFQWLRKRIRRKSYIVQRGIHVLRYKGRPIDFRVMIQKGRKAKWKVTGTAARVAHPRKAVTNGSQGGSIYSTRVLLRRTTGNKQARRLLSKFNRMARLTARRFSQAYPRMNELGLDIAVDRRNRAWILEVNTRPDPCPFTKLADSSMLRRIVRYAKGYGRNYSLKCIKAKRGAR
ncbi:YheC/YheD family protein [Cohnella sp.]|uniref:YheC/YheD family protein n=1 Tax=Cohnella sp. TaxID=1883426 RepID=UPI0035693262